MKRLLLVVRLWAILLIGLHLAAPFLPEAQSWGIFPYGALPRPLQWLGALAGLALCVGPLNAGVRRILNWLADRWPASLPPRLGYALFTILLCPLFWAGRIVHTRWGDAYILVNAIPHSEARLTYSWQAPFDLFLHAKAWALTHRLWGWDATQVYQVISVIAGVFFVFLLLNVAHDLGRNRAERAAVAGLIGTLGLMQFYFGYIENYVLMTIGVLLYLWLGLRQCEGRASLAAPAGVLALTNAFHPSTIFGLEPALVWLWLRAWRAEEGERLQNTLRTVIPLVIVLAGVVLFMQAGGHGLGALLGNDAPGGGDARWFVPLTTLHSKWERYTMFSLAHLLDIINEQLLVAPFTLPLILALLAGRRGRAALRRPGGAFLLIAAASYLLFTLVWNPDYGGRRDWDLFAPAALPLTLLAAWLLIGVSRQESEGDRPGALGEIVLIIAGVSALFTAAWVYSNTLPWSWG